MYAASTLQQLRLYFNNITSLLENEFRLLLKLVHKVNLIWLHSNKTNEKLVNIYIFQYGY